MSSQDSGSQYGDFQQPAITPTANSTTASRGLRFGGYLLESLLLVVTLFIGWVIWSLIVWGRGQTPAKQVLKMRVIDERTGRAAEWGRMAIREFVIPMIYTVAYLLLILVSGSFDDVINGTSSWYLVVVQIVFFVISLADTLWIFRPEHKRLTDVLAGTKVIKEN